MIHRGDIVDCRGCTIRIVGITLEVVMAATKIKVGSVLFEHRTTFIVEHVTEGRIGGDVVILQPKRYDIRCHRETWCLSTIQSWVRDGLVRHVGVAVGYGRI